MNQVQAPYVFEYTIQLDDLDYMGIVGHANWLILLQRSRTDVLNAMGFPFEERMKAGMGAAITHLSVTYHHPATAADRIRIEVHPYLHRSSTCLMKYKVVNGTNEQLLVEAQTTLVFLNEFQKPTRVPAGIRAHLLSATFDETTLADSQATSQ